MLNQLSNLVLTYFQRKVKIKNQLQLAGFSPQNKSS